jgi:molybdopterin-guanine dinucleotide biosynthesis protein A
VTEPASVIVLCGGAGRRAGGQDKPLIELSGEPLIAHLRRRLGGIGPLLISANRNADRYADYGRVVPDQLDGHQGPLAGIAACLPLVAGDFAFVCPGDCPLASAALAHRLLEALAAAQPNVGAAAAHDGERRQPLHLAVRKNQTASLESYLAAGGRSVHAWLDQVGTVDVPCGDLADAFQDLDDAADLDRLARRLGAGDSV